MDFNEKVNLGAGLLGGFLGPKLAGFKGRFLEKPTAKLNVTENPCPGNNPLQSALANSPLRASQPSLSEPVVNAYAARLLNGEIPPPIKVADGVIVSGHHRYAASRLTGIEIPSIEWYISEGQAAKSIPMSEVVIDPVDWGMR